MQQHLTVNTAMLRHMCIDMYMLPQARDEAQEQLLQQHGCDLQKAEQRAQAAEADALAAHEALQQGSLELEGVHAAQGACQARLAQLERAVQCLRKRLARRTRQLQDQVARQQPLKDTAQQQPQQHFNVTGTLHVEGQLPRPASAPQSGAGAWLARQVKPPCLEQWQSHAALHAHISLSCPGTIPRLCPSRGAKLPLLSLHAGLLCFALALPSIGR